MIESFADFLKHYIKQKDWSGQELADNIEEDGGLVRAWIRGQRVPSVGHKCIAKLSEILDIPQATIEQYQMKSLDRRTKQKEQNREEKRSSGSDLRYLASSQPLSSQKDFNYRIPETLEGAREVVKAVISILERNKKIDESVSMRKELLLTFHGRKSSLSQSEELSDRWINAIQALLERGWKVDYLIRLDEDWLRIIKFAKFLLSTIDKSQLYQTYFFQQKYVLEPHNGYLIIPDKEALEFYATQQFLYTDAAFYFKDIKHVKILESHFSRLKEKASPIFERYKTYQQPQFVRAITEADEEFGNRTIVLKRLCEITRPISWYEPNSNWARSLQQFLDCSDRELIENLAVRKNRLTVLEKHLAKEKYEFRYIFPKSCLQEFIREGTTSKYKDYSFRANVRERLDQLENLVRLLVSYPNFQIALLDGENDLIFDDIKPSFCEVQGGHIFFMEVRVYDRELDKEQNEWFLTKEPTIVEAFEKYLIEIWKGIPNRQKNRYVLQWLNEQIENLKEEIK